MPTIVRENSKLLSLCLLLSSRIASSVIVPAIVKLVPAVVKQNYKLCDCACYCQACTYYYYAYTYCYQAELQALLLYLLLLYIESLTITIL